MEISADTARGGALANVLPHRLLHTARPDLPEGLYPAGIQLVEGDRSFQLPGQGRHILAIQLRDPVTVRGRWPHPFQTTSRPGAIYMVPSGEATECHYSGTPTVLVLLLAPRLLESIALQTFEGSPDGIELLARHGERDPLLFGLGRAFLAELQSGGLAGRLYLETLSQLLAVHLLRQHSSLARDGAAPADDHLTARLRRVLDYVNAHLHQNLTLAEIAAEVHLSPYHLTRSFKQSMGVPLHQYIIAQRVERGRRLLESERYTVGEVAGLIGFADQSHFAHHFKRRFGITPSALSRRRKNLPA